MIYNSHLYSYDILMNAQSNLNGPPQVFPNPLIAPAPDINLFVPLANVLGPPAGPPAMTAQMAFLQAFQRRARSRRAKRHRKTESKRDAEE